MDFGIVIIRKLTPDNALPHVPFFTAEDSASEVSKSAVKSLFVLIDDVAVVICGIIFKPSIEDEIVTHGIDSKSIEREERVHNITSRFGHLLAPHSPVSMDEDLSRWGNIQCHE
jgi:hypothetical protein